MTIVGALGAVCFDPHTPPELLRESNKVTSMLAGASASLPVAPGCGGTFIFFLNWAKSMTVVSAQLLLVKTQSLTGCVPFFCFVFMRTSTGPQRRISGAKCKVAVPMLLRSVRHTVKCRAWKYKDADESVSLRTQAKRETHGGGGRAAAD